MDLESYGGNKYKGPGLHFFTIEPINGSEVKLCLESCLSQFKLEGKSHIIYSFQTHDQGHSLGSEVKIHFGNYSEKYQSKLH